MSTAAPAPAGEVFVTGASGRIGTALRERLPALGYKLRCTDIRTPDAPEPGDFVQIDLSDLDGVTRAMEGCRALVHLAGFPREADWETIRDCNLSATYNAFEAARRAGVGTVIYASSNHYCGLLPSDVRIGGDLPPRPTGLYGASKVFGEALLQTYAEAFGLVAFAWRICSFRPKPGNARELSLWLSHDDSARFVDRCLRWSEPGFHVAWGVSNNSRLDIDDPVARMIGYAPQDDAELYAAELAAAGVDTSVRSEWPWLGGDKAEDWICQTGGVRER